MQLHGEYQYNEEFAKKLSLEFTAAYSDKGSHHGYQKVHTFGMKKLNLGLIFLNN